MRRLMIVFAGGGVGSCLRALVLAWLAPWAATLPAPVLLANLVGAFVLSVVVVLADEAGLLRPETRLFLAVGVFLPAQLKVRKQACRHEGDHEIPDERTMAERPVGEVERLHGF